MRPARFVAMGQIGTFQVRNSGLALPFNPLTADLLSDCRHDELAQNNSARD